MISMTLSADLLGEVDARSPSGARSTTLERSLRRYFGLLRSHRPDLEVFTLAEWTFLAAVYPGLFLDRAGALPFVDQIAAALRAGRWPGLKPAGTAQKIRKLSGDAILALIDVIETSRTKAASAGHSGPELAKTAGAISLAAIRDERN